jgi:BirA family biotin operon repressor/biotin-[acetyl-CoA-carboxylase] ligase
MAVIGRLRLHYEAVGSTNDVARALARASYPHGTAIVADYQSAGRGRQGRRWEAPPGTALLCSILLRPRLPARDAALLSMAAALATADAVTAATGLPAVLKWPNDILLPASPGVAARPGAPRKAAGLLLEATLAGPAIAVAILGIGINISASPPDLPSATSLAHAAGRPIDRAVVLDALLAHLEARLALPDAASGDALYAAWRSRLVTLGQPVHVVSAGDAYDAVAEDVNRDGSLRVRRADGQRHHLLAADVTLSHPRWYPPAVAGGEPRDLESSPPDETKNRSSTFLR